MMMMMELEEEANEDVAGWGENKIQISKRRNEDAANKEIIKN